MRPRYPQCQCPAHEAAAGRPDDALVQRLADLACEMGEIAAGLARKDDEIERIVQAWIAAETRRVRQ